ncbi:hypothetical protein NMG60_11031421 [Bertholletia excelsa]
MRGELQISLERLLTCYWTENYNGSFRINSSVLFWYFLISLSATVLGLNLCGFFTPPVAEADLVVAFAASNFLGAFLPGYFSAACFVLAIFYT